MKTVILMVLASVTLAGCAAASYKEFVASNGDVVRIVDTGVDLAGGPRIKVIDTVESRTGKVNPNLQVGAQNVGTFQDATDMSVTGALGAWIGGHYYAQGQKNLRPDNTNMIQQSGDVSATSGGVGEGAVNIENSATGGAVGDVSASARGGAGGSSQSSSSAGAGATLNNSVDVDKSRTDNRKISTTRIDNSRKSVVNAGIRGDGNVVNTGDGNDINTDIDTDIDIDKDVDIEVNGGGNRVGLY